MPDFSIDMVMPIPDYSDIFAETASENERLYNDQLDYEKQIQDLKKQSYEMQLQEAQVFYDSEMDKLNQHYLELTEKNCRKN